MRNADNRKPDAPQLATKITYNEDTLADFRLFTRDKSNHENPWIERTEILEDKEGVLPGKWERVNTAAARRNEELRRNRGNPNVGNKRKREKTNITPEGKKKMSPILNILSKGATPPTFQMAPRQPPPAPAPVIQIQIRL